MDAALLIFQQIATSEIIGLGDDDSLEAIRQLIAVKKIRADLEESLGAFIAFDDAPACVDKRCRIVLKKGNAASTQFHKFESELLETKNNGVDNAYVYAVTPKEMVQRISDVAAQRRASQVGISLNALLGAVGLGASLNRVRDTELMLHALRRQPLVVGFTDRRTVKTKRGPMDNTNEISSKLEFGWLIGPQYKLVEDRRSFFGGTEVTFSFRHVNRQNAIAAVVAVPSWWDALKLEVVGCWLNSESGTKNDCGGGVRGMIDAAKKKDDDKYKDLEIGRSFEPEVTTLTVRVPRDLSAIGAALGVVGKRAPRAFRQAVIADLTVGATGHVLIPGVQLWRNTMVTVGSQKADRVTVMPDIHGKYRRSRIIRAPISPATTMNAPIKSGHDDGGAGGNLSWFKTAEKNLNRIPERRCRQCPA